MRNLKTALAILGILLLCLGLMFLSLGACWGIELAKDKIFGASTMISTVTATPTIAPSPTTAAIPTELSQPEPSQQTGGEIGIIFFFALVFLIFCSGSLRQSVCGNNNNPPRG